nr:MAG: hypothetical protein TU35_04970 [Thermoproteus sp. AZ2]
MQATATITPPPGQTIAVNIVLPISGLRIAGIYVTWPELIVALLLLIVLVVVVAIVLIEYNIWRSKRLAKALLSGARAAGRP